MTFPQFSSGRKLPGFVKVTSTLMVLALWTVSCFWLPEEPGNKARSSQTFLHPNSLSARKQGYLLFGSSRARRKDLQLQRPAVVYGCVERDRLGHPAIVIRSAGSSRTVLADLKADKSLCAKKNRKMLLPKADVEETCTHCCAIVVIGAGKADSEAAVPS